MFQLLNRKTPDRDPEDSREDTSTINLERVGRTRIKDLVSSAREVPWILTLAQLLWTAGPVTFLALQGGSLLGYGEAVGFKTYLFFAIYVALAGLIAVIARVMAKAIRGRREMHARDNITRTLDMIPDLIFTARDLHLSTLSKPQRKRDAAAILLRKQDLGATAISVAVLDLTDDSTLAAIAQEIEVFRRAGMYSRIQDLNNKYREHIETAMERLKDYSGDIADILQQRLQGLAPSLDEGVSRGDNFISQTFAAAHQDDLSLVTLDNVEDILALAFELLSGRAFTRLSIDYEGDWQLARALDELEGSRNAYLQTRASTVLYLRELAYFLVRSRLTQLEMTVLDNDSETLLQETSVALTRLAARLKWSSQDSIGHHTGARTDLTMALRYARLTRQAIAHLQERYIQHVRAVERWTWMRERLLEAAPGPRRGSGLRIRESTIALSDEQKLDFAAQFVRHLDDHDISNGPWGIVRHEHPMSIHHIKHLAIRIALILQPVLDLNKPSVQRALESSRGAHLEGLEKGFTADAKAGLGTAVVKELQDDLGPAAELIALRLTKVYKLPLSKSIRDFLIRHYGANPERLTFIANSLNENKALDETPSIPHQPPLIRGYNEWRTSIETAEKLLGQLLRQTDTSAAPKGRGVTSTEQ